MATSVVELDVPGATSVTVTDSPSQSGETLRDQRCRARTCCRASRPGLVYAGRAVVKQKTQSQRHVGAKPTSRSGQKRNGLSAELREDLRALIARWAPALKELEKH